MKSLFIVLSLLVAQVSFAQLGVNSDQELDALMKGTVQSAPHENGENHDPNCNMAMSSERSHMHLMGNTNPTFNSDGTVKPGGRAGSIK